MQTIKLKLTKPFYIERCKTCFGLFFDPGEIETLLDSSVSNVFDINFKLIKNINKDRYQQKKQFMYIKCPICRVLMNRVNFAHRSGVVVDQCKEHGIWLDSGEITHLMEWKKAGGELLHAKNKQQEKIKKPKPHSNPDYDLPVHRQQTQTFEADLLESVSSLVFKLFQ
jgi:Zn-finger nucleic acid-binding protein